MYLIFVSSLEKNVELSNMINDSLESFGKHTEVINLVDLNIPMYDSFKENNDGVPEVVKSLASKMDKARGYVFVTPEYNFSIPPVQTNAIAWLSRIGDDFRKLFTMKYILLATHSGKGGQDVCNAMRTQFSKLGSMVMPREIIETHQKDIDSAAVERVVKKFADVANNTCIISH